MSKDVKQESAFAEEDKDYVKVITQLKEDTKNNYVPKKDYENALAEKKKLLDALVAGGTVEEKPKETAAELREVMKTGVDNLTYIRASLKLREEALKSGLRDPYESSSEDKNSVVDGKKVAAVLQDIVDNSTSEYIFNARLADAIIDDRIGR